MSISSLSSAELLRALSLRDLSDPSSGPHAMQLVLAELHAAMPAPVTVHRASPIVSVADNYDRLGYPADGPLKPITELDRRPFDDVVHRGRW